MTSHYHGSNISRSQQQGVFATAMVNSKKKNRLRLAKKTLHMPHAFLYISKPLLLDCEMKFPNFTCPLYGVGEHNTKIFFFFF